MKRFSSNITDEELYRLFREAARNIDPKLNDSEKNGVWESIAIGLLTDMYDNFARPENKWRKRCIALLLVWLLTGGLAIFRIIQLQEKGKQFEILKMGNWENEMPAAETPISKFPHSKVSQSKQQIAPEHEATKGNNIIPDNCFNNNYPDELLPSGPATATDTVTVASDSVALFQEVVIDTLQHIDSCTLEIVKKKLTHPHPVHVGLVTGIEWSNISGNPAGKAGVVYGILIQYRLSARWSLETGCIVTEKQYRAQDAYFRRAVATRTAPKMTDVECRVIDIPLNVRFDVMHKKEGRLYTGAGLSSYLMQKEDYLYYFDNGGTWNLMPALYYNKRRHYMGVANLMAGYEYIYRRISLQLTPFLKLPLQELGVARVEPVSKGLLFSVRYLW